MINVGNFAPTIDGSDVMLVTINEPFIYEVAVNDSNGDAITVTTSLNDSAVIDHNTDTGYVTINFTLQMDHLPEIVSDFAFTVTAKVIQP